MTHNQAYNWSTIFGELLKLQRKYRSVEREFGLLTRRQQATHAGTAERIVLYVLDAVGACEIKELASILRLERSWTSRMTAGLQRRRLIIGSTPRDQRRKYVTLTPKGQQALIEVQSENHKIADHVFTSLSKPEQEELQKILKNLADGLQAPIFRYRPEAHNIDLELERIQCVSGALGKKVLGIEVSLTQLQILQCLEALNGQVALISELAEVLPYDISTISRTITRFEKQGLIKKIRSLRDRRSFLIRMSAAGKRRLEQFHEDIGRQLANSLSDIPYETASRLESLLGRLTATIPDTPDCAHKDQIEVRVLESVRDHERAAQLLTPLQLDNEPDDSSAVRAGLYHAGELKGAVILLRSPQHGALTTLRMAGKELNPSQCLALVRSVLDEH